MANSQHHLKRSGALLLRYLRAHRRLVLALGLVIAGDVGLRLINPQIMRTFIDSAVAAARGAPTGAGPRLLPIALTYLAVAVFTQATSFATVYLSESIAWRATNALRRDLLEHVLGLDMAFHKAHMPGELIERIDGDVSNLTHFFSQLALRLLSGGLLALGILVVLFAEDWRIGLMGLAYALLVATALRAAQRRAVEAWGDSRQASGEMFAFLGERLGATEDIRAHGAEAHTLWRLNRLMRTLALSWRRAKLVQALSQAAGSLAFNATRVGALAIGAGLFLSGRVTIGTVYLLMVYFDRLRQPLAEIRHNMESLQRAGASIERVLSLLDTRPGLVEAPSRSLAAGALSVSLRDVSFQYEAGRDEDEAAAVIHDISFSLAPGRVLGLLGRTGSGKTTLTRLLFRLYDPSAGQVLLGDADLRDLSLSELRRSVGLVTQNVQLFQGSLRDNVALFSKAIPDGLILDALRELGLWAWYQSLPQGLDTKLLADGRSLSAGEAQLLAFARVLLKDPGLVILDEASSRLDPATEQL
ncbi:MAG: ABC transporter ATP-binding protein, partial [Anaerolineae bacterium]|nr:ABC transporter ATP-binding protein [Anaerolineae bacterium]